MIRINLHKKYKVLNISGIQYEKAEIGRQKGQLLKTNQVQQNGAR